MTTVKNQILAVKNELLLLLASTLVFGLLFALLIPIAHGQDEPVHAYKAAAIAKGQFTPIKIGPWQTAEGTPITVYGGYVPESLVRLEQTANTTKLSSPCSESRCASQDSPQLEAIKSEPINSRAILTDFWGANSYSFIGYIPSSIGFLISQLLNTSTESAIIISRIINLAFCSITITVAFLLVSKMRFRWVIFSLALLPPSIISFSSLGIDGPLVALSILFCSILAISFTYHAKTPPTWIISLGLAVAIMLPLIKLPYLLLSCLIVLTPIIRKGRYSWLCRIFVIAAIVTPSLLWSIATSDPTRTQSLTTYSGQTEPNTAQQVEYILHNPYRFAKTFTSSFFNNNLVTSINRPIQQPGLILPNDLIMLSLLVVAVAVLYSANTFPIVKNKKLYIIATFSSCIGIVVGIGLIMYLTYNSVGSIDVDGVQGRYFIPLYGLIALALALTLPVSIKQVHTSAKKAFLAIAVTAPILSLLWYINIVY